MAETEEVTAPAETANTKVQAQTAEFNEVADSGSGSGENLDILLDIEMPVTVVLGKTEVPFKRLLQLAPGSVLELDKAVGSPAELFVQGIQLAIGDVVVVNENYGLRIRQVLGGETMRSGKAGLPEKAAKA
ncbi:MAG: FliM/FliN family flagellar motor switch protein [Planctomycetaceae bacterium]|nr:FliM/FliN family flagellar motor switch protein [Planctomycetaceae bacterium]